MFAERSDSRVYIDRSGVAVNDIIENLMTARSIKNTLSKFPINKEEMHASIDYTLDHMLDTEKHPPMVEFNIKTKPSGQLDLQTTEISDWCFLSLLQYGHIFKENVSDCNKLYAYGLKEVVREIMQDITKESSTYKESLLHRTVYEAIVRNYGEIDLTEAENILESI